MSIGGADTAGVGEAVILPDRMSGQIVQGHPLMFAPVAWDFSRAPPRRGKSVEELVSDSRERDRYIQMHMHFQQQQQLQQAIICPQGFGPAPGYLENQAYLKQVSGMHQTCWEYEDCDRIPYRDDPQQRNQFFYHTPEAVFQEPRKPQERSGNQCFYDPKEDVNFSDHRDHIRSTHTNENPNHKNKDRHNYWDMEENYDERDHYSRRDQNAYYDQDKRDYYDKKRGNYRERDRYDLRDNDYYDHKELDSYDRCNQKDLDNYDHKDSMRRDYYDTRQRHRYVYRDTEHYGCRGNESSDCRDTDRYDRKQKDQYDHRNVDCSYSREGEQDHRKYNRCAYREKENNQKDIDRYEQRKVDRSKYREKDIDDRRKGDYYKGRENPDAVYKEKDHYDWPGDAHFEGTYDSRKEARYKLTEKDGRERGRYEHVEQGLREQRQKESCRERARYQLQDADRYDYREMGSRDHRYNDCYDNKVVNYFDDREWEDDQYEQKSRRYCKVSSEGYSSDYDSWKRIKEWEKDVSRMQTVRERDSRSYEDPVTLSHLDYEDTRNGTHNDPDSRRLDREKQGWKKQKALYAGSLDRNSFYRRTAPSSLRKSEFVSNRREKQGKNICIFQYRQYHKSTIQGQKTDLEHIDITEKTRIRTNKKAYYLCRCKPDKKQLCSSPHGQHFCLQPDSDLQSLGCVVSDQFRKCLKVLMILSPV